MLIEHKVKDIMHMRFRFTFITIRRIKFSKWKPGRYSQIDPIFNCKLCKWNALYMYSHFTFYQGLKRGNLHKMFIINLVIR